MTIKHLRAGQGGPWIAAAGLLALVVIAYANSFQAGLTQDSRFLIGLDPRIKAWSTENLRAIFMESYWGPFARNDLYRPVTTLSFMLNHAVWGNGDRVFGYHVVNLLIHGANVLLGFTILRRCGAGTGLAGLAAGLFAVHPVNVEAVTNLAGRADLLAALAVLGSGACYIQAQHSDRGRRLAWLGWAGLIAMAGVFAKESAIMAVGFAVLYDVFFWWSKRVTPPEPSRWRDFIRKAALRGWVAYVPAVFALVAARAALGPNLIPAGRSFVDNPILYAGPVQGFMTATGVIGRYLMLLVFPARLSCDYSYSHIPLFGESPNPADDWFCAVSLVAMIGLGCFAWRCWEGRPLVGWGIVYFFLMLLPVSNLVLRIGSIMAERFLYLPSLGPCAVMAVALQAVGKRTSERLNLGSGLPSRYGSYVLPALVVVAMVSRTHVRNRDWQSESTLWKSATVAVPHSFKAHLALGEAIFGEGRQEADLDAALSHSEKAAEILQRSALAPDRLPQTVFGQLGMFYRYKGEYLAARQASDATLFFRRAIDSLEKAKAIDRQENDAFRRRLMARRGPGDVPISGNPRIYIDLSAAHLHLKDWPSLEAAARELQRHAPSSPLGYSFHAIAVGNQQRYDEAATLFLGALMLNRNDAEVRTNLATNYDRIGIRPSPVPPIDSPEPIDASDPRVRQHLDAALALLVYNHAIAGKQREADEIRSLAITHFGVPAERLRMVVSP